MAPPRAHAALHDLLLALGLLARPALAFHRTTPPVIAVTSSGDTLLPRVSTEGRQLVVALDVSGKQIYRQHRKHDFLERTGVGVVFDSTSDLSGRDTGISQIWFLSAIGFPQILTYGQGPSRRPAISSDGRVIAFESTADLTGNLQDTGVSQIFLYDADKGSLIRVTDDPAGCSGASVGAVPRDISVGYACHGQGFFYHYLAGRHFQLPIDGGDTPQAVVELGGWFMVVSTTANMLGGDPTQGHQLYLLNLFKLAATPLD